MTYTTLDDAYKAGFAARATARASDWLAHAADTLMRRHIERTTRTELSALSTRELEDLGIARADIGRVAHQAAFGKR